MTEKPSTTPSSIPPTSERMEITAESIGFTLKSDSQTLLDIERIHEQAIKAAQNVKKIALR